MASSVAERLAAVRARIAAACVAAGRRTDSVHLIAVTKGHSVEAARELVALSVRDLGESRDQEARVKAQALAGSGVRWHFLGQLQRNKAASVVGYADVLHTVDRLPLVAAVAAAARRDFDAFGRRQAVLVQVSLDNPADREARGGVLPADVPDLAASIATESTLDLRGVMGVAPYAGNAEKAFARLADVAAVLRADHPRADVVSAGMSDDFEAAIAAGATHVRLGTAVLGPRPELR